MPKPRLTEKRWKPEHEVELQKKWKEEKLYGFNEDTEKEILVIDNPPIYPSGSKELPLNPGQLVSYNYIDMVARTSRMHGKEVLYPHCFDRNGIKIERMVKNETGKNSRETGREEFNRLCEEKLDRMEKLINEVFYRCGLSFQEGKHIYRTDSEDYRKLTQQTFKELWDHGLIYEDHRPNNWCPNCRTAIAEAEVEYKEGSTTLNHIKFKLPDGEEKEIATTRPELLAACQAVLVHPDDERYTQLHGENIEIPIYNRKVPIIPHHYAEKDFGTGMLMICSYGDKADVKIFRELNLDPIEAINKENRMTQRTGSYEGLTVEEARETIIKNLKEEGLLTKQEQTHHRKPVCEACGTRIELIPMKEWYLNQTKFLNQIKGKADEIEFLQPQHKRTLLDWTESVTIDWAVSRRGAYATEIPLWYCLKCNHPIVPEIKRYYRPWKEEPPIEECPKCGGKEFKGEEKVFDTWMDSSISNLYVAGYRRNEERMEKTYPEKIIRVQGRDIIRTWLYYTILKNIQLKDQKAFGKVWIHGMGLNEKGEAMSKSKGNFPDPKPLIEQNGVDALRFYAAEEANIGEDYRVSEERIKGAKKFLTKLWNTARFVSMFEQTEKPSEIKETDKWILSELNRLIQECEEGYSRYNFFPVANKVKNFVQNQFASHYLEMVKKRAYEEDQSALYTLHTVLRKIIKLIAPIAPHITDKIHRELYEGSIHREMMPKKEKEAEHGELTETLMEFNHSVWKNKKDQGIALKEEAKDTSIPKELEPFKEDLVQMHNIKGE